MVAPLPKPTTYDEEIVDLKALFVTPEEGRRLFDEAAREMVGMSGDEFIRRYDAGEFAVIPDDVEHRNIIELTLLIPFGR
ncbi:MAG: hypothetical protein ACRDJH_20420 [Thermomicrobiales bacterium]